MTVTTVLDVFGAAVFEIASAFFAETIEGTITEKAIKIIVIGLRMTGVIFAFTIVEKSVTVFHGNTRPIIVKKIFKSRQDGLLRLCLTFFNMTVYSMLEK